VVLKGAFTVIAEPEARTCVLPIATSALASAGTGDVLAGVILGLRGQGVPAYEAACLGAYLHGRAGQLAALMLGNEASVMAGDLADSLSDAINELLAEG
jgi:NAD(P)H-hydrate epimerase